MPAGMLWMALGIAAVAWLPRLPRAGLLLIAAGMAVLFATVLLGTIAFIRRKYAMSSRRRALAIVHHAAIAALALTLGFIWGCVYGYHIRSGLLPAEFEQRSLLIEGRVDGLVEQRESFAHSGEAARSLLHFQLAIDADSKRTARLPRLIQLNWYDADRSPQPGERWQLRVKLKRPRGFANPGGFDYGGWLIANRIGAAGYVERSGDNQKLMYASRWSIDALRGRAQNYLQQRLQTFSHRDLLLGLLIGDGGAIETNEWDTFRATGTVHLFVVSGLQIAFTGGLILWFARQWWRSPWCASRRRNYFIGVVPACAAALIYALLAGWGVPIQRALIMFAVLVWAVIARRQIRASTSWIAALWLVLLFDPLAVRDMGFWFSFIAVAAILLMVCGHRTEFSPPIMRNALRWWRVQWALFATSLPLLLALSGQLTLLALPANLLAIPLSTFISLPLAFAALLSDFILPPVSDSVWHAADISLDWLWRYLLLLQEHGGAAIWHPRGIDNGICAFAAAAAALVLLPRGMPGKSFAIFLLIPLFAPPLPNIQPGDCAITVIDVGQGLSVLVETSQHRLLYDTGPLFGPDRTVADLTVLPVLRRHRVAALDSVVVSHDDSDHSGGWPAIAREFEVGRLLIGEALKTHSVATAHGSETQAEFCKAGMHWQWDGVHFDVLYPSEAAL